MKKLLLLYNLIIVTIISIGGLVLSSSQSQTITALLFVPMAIYFARQLFQNLLPQPKPKTNDLHLPFPIGTYAGEPIILDATQDGDTFTTDLAPQYQATELITTPAIEGEELSPGQVRDLDKRIFLKLIGSAGLAAFVFALFSKQSHAAFFGSMPGPGIISVKDSSGNLIDPAEKQPTDGYQISEIDDSAIPAYYGFLNKDGAWYISREGSSGEFRYKAGTSNFSTNWDNRASLSYDYFQNIF